MCVLLRLPSGHVVSLQLMWCEAGTHYLCTFLGNLYEMLAGGDGIDLLLVPVGAALQSSQGEGVRLGLKR